MGICGATEKPPVPETILSLPGDEDAAEYVMTRGRGPLGSQPGWEVKNNDGEAWMWLQAEDGSKTGKLEDWEGNELGTYELDSDNEFEVKKKSEWVGGDDSDSSGDSDGSGDGDEANIKLKWKAARKVKFQGGGGNGQIKMKIKGKSNVDVVRNQETNRFEVGGEHSETKKAKYKWKWEGGLGGSEEAWSVGDTSGEFHIPGVLEFNGGQQCCTAEIHVKTRSPVTCVQSKLVPMIAGVCHDNVHQDRIEASMGSRCYSHGCTLARSMNNEIEMS